MSDLEDEPAPGANAGDKRKAEAADWVDTSDNEDEEGAEDAEAHKAAAFANDFWNKVFQRVNLFLFYSGGLYLLTAETGHHSCCTWRASSKHAFIHRCQ